MRKKLIILLNPKAYEEAMENYSANESDIPAALRSVPERLYRIPDGECLVMDTSTVQKEPGMPFEVIDYVDKLPAPPASPETMHKVWAALRTLHSGFAQMASAIRKSNTDCKTLTAVMLKARGK